jgi:O-antigen/teichoic acid export membrane protein
MTKPAVQVAEFLTLAIPIRLMNAILTSLLQRAGRFDKVLSASVMTGLVTWCFALGLGHKVGIIGAAAGVLIAESFNFLYLYKVTRCLFTRTAIVL